MRERQRQLRTPLYFLALDPAILPVHLQSRGAQFLLEQPPSSIGMHNGTIGEALTHRRSTQYAHPTKDNRNHSNTSNSAPWRRRAATWRRGDQKTVSSNKPTGACGAQRPTQYAAFSENPILRKQCSGERCQCKCTMSSGTMPRTRRQQHAICNARCSSKVRHN